jgi:hypothetical protein
MYAVEGPLAGISSTDYREAEHVRVENVITTSSFMNGVNRYAGYREALETRRDAIRSLSRVARPKR